ncbi:MAG: HD-GYP domain-containing protein [Thermodesulfobacteriota bacterium]
MTDSDSSMDRPIYNSRIVQPYIQLIRKKYPDLDLSRLLTYAGMKAYEVNDEGHWFSQRQLNRFHEQLIKMTNNEHIARQAGRSAALPECIGAMRHYILGLVTPRRAFKMIGRAAANFTRSARYESRRLARNKYEITVAPPEGHTEEPFQCENRMGFLEAVLTLFNYKLSKIEHPECVFTGDAVCRYIVSWEQSFADHFRRIKNFAFFVFLFSTVLSLLFLPLPTALSVTVLLFTAFLTLAFVNERLDKYDVTHALTQINDSSEKLLEHIDLNYNNTMVTREIGQVVNRHANLEEVLNEIVGILENRLDYDRGMIMLANKSRTRLSFHAGYGYADEQYHFLRKINFHLDKPDSKGVFVVSFKDHKPFLINDINAIEQTLSRRSIEFARQMGAQAFICCPIICDNESLGVLAVDNVKTKRMFVQSDMSLLMGISHVIGISIRHTQHLESREKQLQSVVQVMVSSIDARDPVTKGHSEWVAEYAVGICCEMGLDKDYCEVVRVAALLHDYGKIGVPDALLKKPGRLTENEYEYIKCHAEKTQEILEQINFEGPLKDVPQIASAHHERIDGKGYPLGLQHDEIPLGARIIAVADHFEALTASRYYNTPMAPEKAIAHLDAKVGTFFEKPLVEAFKRYYTKKYGLYDPPMPEKQAAARF